MLYWNKILFESKSAQFRLWPYIVSKIKRRKAKQISTIFTPIESPVATKICPSHEYVAVEMETYYDKD